MRSQVKLMPTSPAEVQTSQTGSAPGSRRRNRWKVLSLNRRSRSKPRMVPVRRAHGCFSLSNRSANFKAFSGCLMNIAVRGSWRIRGQLPDCGIDFIHICGFTKDKRFRRMKNIPRMANPPPHLPQDRVQSVEGPQPNQVWPKATESGMIFLRSGPRVPGRARL